jgi:hypothetical protein
MPAIRNKDVGGLDVAMDDSSRVCSVTRIRNLDGQREDYIGVQGPSRNLTFSANPSRTSVAMKTWSLCSSIS